MRLPQACSGRVEWAYPGDEETPCLRTPGADRMLCGRLLHPDWVLRGFVPTVQPVDPEPVCGRCERVLKGLFGWCPVCGVELVGDGQGRTPGHDGCVGVNLPLRRTR